jgi:cytochrome P450
MRALIARKRLVASDESDVLATLLRAHDEDGGKMSDDELMGQMFLLFFAGHDTTRNTLAWTMFLLATHPKVYDALADEVDGLLKGSAPTIEQISALPLLDRVVKESLRLFPSAPFTMRSSQRATELNGVYLPAGSEVVLSYYHTHRNPDIFPDPQHFRPERWEGLNPSAFEYLPFGAGARQCIGMGFASMEVRIVLAMVVQQFRLSFPANTRIDRQTRIVLSPSPGLPMQIRGRSEAPLPNTAIRGNVRSMVVLPE